jgi:hypothetical protein
MASDDKGAPGGRTLRQQYGKDDEEKDLAKAISVASSGRYSLVACPHRLLRMND